MKKLLRRTRLKTDETDDFSSTENSLTVEPLENQNPRTALTGPNEALEYQSYENEELTHDLAAAEHALESQNLENEDLNAELISTDKALSIQIQVNKKRATDLVVANEELRFENREKEKRAAELVIANKELIFQNKEKEKRAAELVIANEELKLQNIEKEKRAAELVIANEELKFQNEEKEKRAAELVIANNNLQHSLMNTVKVAMTLGELRDPYTAGHERRVAELAVAISAELGFDKSRQEGMRVAGYLHDIGKMVIPAEILSKPGKLNAIEYQLIQMHARTGHNVLKSVDFPWPIAKVVLQHHERLDGSGYPEGLIGDDIILEARIMAIADVVEAMSSHRPYRPSRGTDIALTELERGRGTIYDAHIVDTTLKLFREKGYEFPEDYGVTP